MSPASSGPSPQATQAMSLISVVGAQATVVPVDALGLRGGSASQSSPIKVSHLPKVKFQPAFVLADPRALEPTDVPPAEQQSIGLP